MAATMRMTQTTARRGAQPPMLDTAIDGPIAWRRGDLTEADWRVAPDATVLAEVDALARRFAAGDAAFDQLTLAELDAPATRALMAEIRRRLVEGIGFAVLDRLPAEDWSEHGARAVGWLLSNAVAPAVRQKWSSPSRMYDVRDTGAKHDYGVRRSLTNLRQEFHTDGPWLTATANFMGLACLRQAEGGGTSYVASLVTVHNQLRALYPDLLPRLYRPFHWDRQKEHASDATPAAWLPVFDWDGTRLHVRYYDDYIHSGYRLMQQELDAEGAAALAAMQAIIEQPENSLEFRLSPGQTVFANNHLLAHGRSAFTDSGATPRGRLLLRLWLRPTGGIGFEADTDGT